MTDGRRRAFLTQGKTFPDRGKIGPRGRPHPSGQPGQMLVVTPVSAAAHRLASLFDHQAGEMGSA